MPSFSGRITEMSYDYLLEAYAMSDTGSIEECEFREEIARRNRLAEEASSDEEPITEDPSAISSDTSLGREDYSYLFNESETLLCSNCGADIKEGDESYETRYGYPICEECYGTDFFACDNCDRIWPNRHFRESPDGESLCTTCFQCEWVHCDECGYCTRRGNSREVEEVIICEDCYEAETCNCDSCGDRFFERDLDENGLCPDCRSRIIYNYDYRPRFEFFGSRAENPYLGIELEVECQDHSREDIATQLNIASDDDHRIYFKHDGSLTNGFEIVSHPCTLNYHKNEMGWKVWMKKLLELGCRSHLTRTCGLHVHLSSQGLKTVHRVRMSLLVYTQQDFFKAVSRRNYCTYAEYNGDKPLKMHGKNTNRYEAINFRNSRTVEFRMFKGTLLYSTFMARVELVHAIYRLSKNMTGIGHIIKKPAATKRKMLDFIAANKKQYAFLNAYLKKLEII